MANGSPNPRADLVWHWLNLRIAQEQSSSVMLVFPDTPRRGRLEEAMHAVGLRTSCLARAADVIEHLESDPFQTNEPVDLIVIFTKLPDVDGIDLAKFLRTRPYDPELVLVTPKLTTEEAQAAVSVRAAACLGPQESDPTMLAARAKILWEAGLTRRVRKIMIRELRTLAETEPDFASQVLPRIDELVAQHREAHMDKGTVLVADPDRQFRGRLAEALEERGLDVEVATGSATALSIMETEAVDVLVTNPFAAEIPALDFLKAARLANDSVDLVLLTAQRSLDQALEALKEGAADLILKSESAVQGAAQRIAALVQRRNHMAVESLIIQALSDALTGYLAGQDAAARAARDRAFQGMTRAVPPPIPDGAGPGSRGTRLKTLELASGEYEVIGDLAAMEGKSRQSSTPPPGSSSQPLTSPPSSPRGTSGKRSRAPSVMELMTGDYDIAEPPSAADHRDLPDAAVLAFIDEVLYEPGRHAGPEAGEGRRRLDRVERSVLVTYRKPDDTYAGFGYAKDVSLGGLFVSADPVPDVGSELDLQIFLPIEGELTGLQCRAKIAWTTVSDADRLETEGPGFGLQFTDLSAEASDLLRRFLTENS